MMNAPISPKSCMESSRKWISDEREEPCDGPKTAEEGAKLGSDVPNPQTTGVRTEQTTTHLKTIDSGDLTEVSPEIEPRAIPPNSTNKRSQDKLGESNQKRLRSRSSESSQKSATVDNDDQLPKKDAQGPAPSRTCVGCRLAKVKCDKQIPCSRCVRLRNPCLRQTRVRGRPKKSSVKQSKTHQNDSHNPFASLLPYCMPASADSSLCGGPLAPQNMFAQVAHQQLFADMANPSMFAHQPQPGWQPHNSSMMPGMMPSYGAPPLESGFYPNMYSAGAMKGMPYQMTNPMSDQFNQQYQRPMTHPNPYAGGPTSNSSSPLFPSRQLDLHAPSMQSQPFTSIPPTQTLSLDSCISTLISTLTNTRLEYAKVASVLRLLATLARSTSDWNRSQLVNEWGRLLGIELDAREIATYPINLMTSAPMTRNEATHALGVELPSCITSLDDDMSAVCRHVVTTGMGGAMNVVFSCNEACNSHFVSSNEILESWKVQRCIFKTLGTVVSEESRAVFDSGMADLILRGSAQEHTVSLPTLSFRQRDGTKLSGLLKARLALTGFEKGQPAMIILFKIALDLPSHHSAPAHQFTAV